MFKKKFAVTLILIMLLAIATRFLGNGYDNYGHLHPDERWLVMVVGKLHLFDQLNPDFFAYGSLPMYLLKSIAQGGELIFNQPIDTYDGLLVWGRRLVSVLDIGVVVLTGVLTWQVTKRKAAALMGSLLYCLLFFPIQNSNFFIVDNFVNFFFALTVACLFVYLRKPNTVWLVLLGIVYAAAISSKVTPILFAPFLILLITLVQFKPQPKIQLRQQQLRQKMTEKLEAQPNIYQNLDTHTSRRLQTLFLILLKVGSAVLIFVSVTLFCTYIFMPYSFIHFDQFKQEVTNQLAMNSNAFVFPYTLQYVTTQPYLYYLQNIFWYGAGPVISILACIGIIRVLWKTVSFITRSYRRSVTTTLGSKLSALWHIGITLCTQHLAFMFVLFASMFFLIIGKSAVKFMRYLLLLYPFIAVMAALAIQHILQNTALPWKVNRAIILILLALATVWTTSFLSIYLRPHTRIQATQWMQEHIPAGSTLAVEHWDDRLPLHQGEQYRYVELPLYEQPDDRTKWNLVELRLDQADYIILASNRLFTPLPKLASCAWYEKCYPLTTEYYHRLFAEQLGFTKVAEFTSRPRLPTWLGKWEIIDDNADESFTVYDHPRVIIFKRQTYY